MNQAASSFSKRSRSSRGASTAEYALCCLFLCVGITGTIHQLSGGVQTAFNAIGSDSIAQASVDCPICSSGGGGGFGDGENNIFGGGYESYQDRDGGGSVGSETIRVGGSFAEEESGGNDDRFQAPTGEPRATSGGALPTQTVQP
ncbi:MAG: hypothetical protein J0M12_12065 [Deltaproteobacteria bacterium]|nr:hypothetical protein [Deltaproteobacteria bacterium]